VALLYLITFESKVLRRIFGPKKEEVTGTGENYIVLEICITHVILTITFIII
jgi:hypothetical protein